MERELVRIDLNRDFEAFKALSLTCFGSGANVDLAMHRWLLDENPYNPDGNLIFLLKEGEKGIACDGLIPNQLYLNGKTLLMAHSVKTMTHPEYQRQGIFRKMTENSLEAGKKAGVDVVLGLANAASYPGYQKFGWLSLSEKEVLMQPIHIEKYLKRKLKVPFLAKIGDWLFTQINRRRMGQKPSDLTFQWMDQVPPEVQSCWDRYKDKYKVLLVRDYTYLNYRYNQRPDVAYKTLIARKDGDIVGFAILRQGRTDHSVLGNVTEFFTDPLNPHFIREMSKALTCYALSQRWDYLVLSCGGYGDYDSVLKSMGYRTPPTPPSNNQMIALILSDQVTPEELGTASDWHLSQGEGDIELDLRS